jgi:hypothetical protein
MLRSTIGGAGKRLLWHSRHDQQGRIVLRRPFSGKRG